MKEIILRFLNENNIFFVESGPNVSKNNVNIKCPFCQDDLSQHLGINLKNGIFGCWRNSSHKGNFTYLVKTLINCSWEEAVSITGKKTSSLTIEDTNSVVNNIFNTDKEQIIKSTKKLKLPSGSKPIKKAGIPSSFYEYFLRRGFTNKARLNKLIKQKNFQACLMGQWSYRIIFPIYYQGEMVTWTSRSISDHTLKYLDLSIDESLRHVKQCVYDYDDLSGGKILFITEGIFDCLKLQFYLPRKYSATCMFTKTIRDEQIYLISQLSKKYAEIKILLDSDAQLEAMKIKNKLSFLRNISLMKLPVGIKDPGEMVEEQILNLI